jgi:DNA primase
MALPAGFLDELRARTPMAPLIGRRVRLAKSGREWKGCCPFHAEKTPSFVVYDDGYHCFGCGAHGDCFSFVMQSQGVSFMEAVEQLAAEAGMEVPKPSPAAAEAERRRFDLYAVLEAAAKAFQRRLKLPEGTPALRYLRERGLTDATIERFDLGWSPGQARGGERCGAIAADLAREGIELPTIIAAGLMKPSEDGRPAYDFFFNRVMFPIRDRRGRVISFGGRVLGDGQPKYLNGPETEVFVKGRTLFGLDAAHAGARSGAQVVAVEGYIDVIALHQADFAGAVAPLGTALTEQQLEELWRLSPMPVLCFDGDAGGARAAARTAELALPLLSAERSLRLASLPAGEDPDTLVRGHGAAAFQGVLDAARPLADALYDLVREASGDATPEQRAALRTRLEAAAAKIRDRALATEYRRALMDRFFVRRGARGPVKPAIFQRAPAAPARAAAERGRNLLAIILRHPALLHDVEEAFDAVELPPALNRLRREILRWGEVAEALDSQALMNHLTEHGLAAEAAQALAAVPYPLPACAAPDAMPAEAEAGWWHIFGLMHRGRLEAEVAAAMRELAEHSDAAAQRRLIALCTARNALREDDHGTETER